jgi:Fur family ferric uptake transcriptional regulator
VKTEQIRRAFEQFLRSRSLKLTPQRERVFDRAFGTHEHFSAETFYGWMQAEEGPRVSRATVYRTLALLQEGGFIESLDTGRGEVVYEHTLGHRHHDHMVCLDCGRIEEFHDDRIEELQQEAAAKKGFELVSHDHRLMGYCRRCRKKGSAGQQHAAGAETGAPPSQPGQAPT